MKKLSVLAMAYHDRVGVIVLVKILPPLRYAGRGGDVGRSTTNMPLLYLKSRYLHKQLTKRNNMDPIHYEKIADKLMQFRGKLPKDSHLQLRLARDVVDDVKNSLDVLLDMIDKLSADDEKGYIR